VNCTSFADLQAQHGEATFLAHGALEPVLLVERA
jgi:hypothetical protein